MGAYLSTCRIPVEVGTIPLTRVTEVVVLRLTEYLDEFSYEVGRVGVVVFGCGMQDSEVVVGEADGDAVWESLFVGWEESPNPFADSRAGGCGVVFLGGHARRLALL